MTFIRLDNHFGQLGMLLACVAFAFWLERVPWAKRLSATLFVFGVPLVLSNRQVIPCQAPVRRSYQDCLSLLSRDGLWRLLPNKALLLTRVTIGSRAAARGQRIRPRSGTARR